MSIDYKPVVEQRPYRKCDKCGCELNIDKITKNDKQWLTTFECDEILTEITHTEEHISYDKFSGRSLRHHKSETRLDLCPECYQKFLEWLKEK